MGVEEFWRQEGQIRVHVTTMSFCFPDSSMRSILSNLAGGKQAELGFFKILTQW